MDWSNIISVFIGGGITYIIQNRLEKQREKKRIEKTAVNIQFALNQFMIDCKYLLDKYCIPYNKCEISEFNKLPIDDKIPNMYINTIKENIYGLDNDIYQELLVLMVTILKARNNISTNQTSSYGNKGLAWEYGFDDYHKNINELMLKSYDIAYKLGEQYVKLKCPNIIYEYLKNIK